MIPELVALELDTPCALDPLLYLSRHPNIYVTTEWLPARLGYLAEDVEAGGPLATPEPSSIQILGAQPSRSPAL